MDHYLIKNKYPFTRKRWFAWLGSGPLPIRRLAPKVLVMSLFIFALTLFTNQYFHGGVFGDLHNKSVRPKVEISNVQSSESQLSFQLFRVEGADVYGSFLIEIQILDDRGQVIKSIGQRELANFPLANIHNHYVAKIKPGKHSLVLPLGAKADISIELGELTLSDKYTLRLIDISGIEWSVPIPI